MDGETCDGVMILQKAESLCGQPRRNSSGIMAAPNLQPPILSRYLRASAGSCHDLCKYGRKHNSEATTNYLKSRRKASISRDLHNRYMTSNQLEGNEKSVVNVDKSPDSAIVKTDDSRDLHNQYMTSNQLEGNEKPVVNVDKSPDSAIVKTDDSWSTQEGDIIVKKAAISGDRCDQDKTSASLEGKEESLVNVDESPKSIIVKRDDSLSTQYEGDVIVKKAAIYDDLYDQDKTSASFQGKEKALLNVDESSMSIIVKTDDSLLTLDRDVSFQQPGDPDVTRDLAADLKENSVLPSPSTHFKEGTGDKVLKDAEGAPSVAAPKSSSSRKTEKIRSTKAARVSVDKKKKILPSAASIAPERSSRRGSNREMRNYKHGKLTSNQKNCSISRAEPSNCEDVAEKTSHFAVADVRNKMAGTAENRLLTLDKSPKAERERRSNEKITPKFPPSSEKKKLRCSVNSCGLAKLPPSSDKKNRRRIGRHVNQSPSSSSLLLTSLPPTPKSNTSGTSSEHEAAEKGNPEACSNTNRPKRVSTGSSEVKNCQPQNPPFRRGKVVEPRLENVPPRKLRFQRPKLLGESQIGKGDAMRKFSRRKDVGSPEHKSIKSEKIVLKHRHVEKRENARSLFNNVIEETASKLVETRKSKVKALVGAFETVISLQDTKPKATVAAC